MATLIDDELKRATVFVALNDMIRRGSFSICTIDKCADILGVQLKGSEPYRASVCATLRGLRLNASEDTQSRSGVDFRMLES